MKCFTCTALAAFLFFGSFVGGCDRTVHEEKTVKHREDGTTVTDEKKTTVSPDGTVKKTEEHTAQ